MAAVAGTGAAVRTICSRRSTVIRRSAPATRVQVADPSPSDTKIVLQPRISNLRSYGDASLRGVPGVASEALKASTFFSSLAEYVENSRKSRDFETLSGRLAMIVFATAVGVELVTGDSLFRKLDIGEIQEASALCASVVAMAASFAWATSAKARIGQILTMGCSNFVDGLIDDLVDGLFYESDNDDWADDLQ